MAADFFASKSTTQPHVTIDASEALSLPAVTDTLAWLRYLAVADNCSDFIVAMHKALGYRPGVIVAPELVLRSIETQRRLAEENTARLKAKVIAQLEAMDRGETL